MSDIPVTLAAGSLRPTGTAGGGEAAVRVIDPSPDLARLATGESLRGTVVGKDDHGHLLVRTRLGVLTLAVPRPLPVGTEVVLQVRNVGPQVMLTLMPLGSAAGSGVQPGQGTQLPVVSAPQAQSPVHHAADLVQRGQLLRAVLHAAPPMPALAGLPTAQPGTELMARILSLGVQSPGPAATGATPLVQAPVAGTPVAGAPAAGAVAGTLPPAAGATAPGAAPALPGGGSTAKALAGVAAGGASPAAQPPGSTSGAAPAAPQTNPAAVNLPASGPPGSLPPGSHAASASTADTPGLRLAPQAAVASSGHSLATALQGLSAEAAAKAAGSPAATSPTGAGAPAAAPTTPAAGNLRVTGLVTATTSSGQPILHTPLGTLTLDTRAALPPGTSLALEIALPPEGRAAVSLPALAAAWPNLESLEEALFRGVPAAQSEAVARALPQIGPRLASGVLFFLSALNQGNVAGWLAKAGITGEVGDRRDMLDRLGREFAGLSRSIETTAGEWRFVNLPLWSDQGLRELRCFFRHQEHGGRGGGEDENATRFVLELELTHHGELQLDGLVRARLFDLVLRSRRPLPSLVRGDLIALFEETNAIAGYNGRLSFQASQDWMQLLSARSAQDPHEGLRV